MNNTRLTLSDRVSIEAGLYAHKTFKEIAKETGKHPSTISREIRSNRTLISGEKPYGKDCHYTIGCKTKKICGKASCIMLCARCHKYDCRTTCPRYDNSPCCKLDKPPYVCNICERRRKCRADRAYYSAKQADAVAQRRYSETHMGIRISSEHLEQIDNLVSKLIRKGQPLTHIHSEHGDKLGVSQRTLYNYIDAGVFSIGNIDLRRKVGYRPRKKKREQSELFLDMNFRKSRTYNDFQKYMDSRPDASYIEMDTMKGSREQGKRLLTMIFHNTSVMLLFLLRDGTTESVVETFDYLTSLVGVETFRRLFPAILTDNGPEFKHSRDMERTVAGQRRTKVFYCDPYSSWQKPHIEKNHEFVRYVLKKGKSLNSFIQQDMTLLANHINSTKRASLDGRCPYELVEDPEMLKLMSFLELKQVPPDEVCLKPALLNPR